MQIYAKLESELEKEYRPYKEILKEIVLKFGDILNIQLSQKEELILVNTLPHWPPFSDSREALLKILEKYKIAIISNIDTDLIEETIKHLNVDFDYIVTAEMIRAYKPSIRAFEIAHEIFRVPKSRWIHVGQSIYHDIIPAKNYGVKTVLIKRRGYGATLPVKGSPDLVFDNLYQFSKYIEMQDLD